MDPVVLFFLLGAFARLAKSDLRLPEALYETLSIYLLLAIGLKGGVEIAKHSLGAVAPQALAVIAMGALLPLVAFPVLRIFAKLSHADAGNIAAHYGSVSVVTFAVGIAFLTRQQVAYESYFPLFVALLEVPGIVVGILLAKMGRDAMAADAGSSPARAVRWGPLLHEVLLGKSVVLLVGGLIIGWIAGPQGIDPFKGLFFDLFRGVLALFLLEMGLVAAGRIADLKSRWLFMLGFGTLMPICFAVIGIVLGKALGLSVGGMTLLGLLAASASYIAAPTATRIAIPEANPGLSIGLALGVTFPFNITLGMPLYHAIAQRLN
ncbi:MAG: sodium-dependent bicarbonate transport family permease [Burkholderiales bacterium]|nr:sodium-dependent bicarbonate transport family permease [Burkholderiales bacterium]